jgi:hypothetical protein
MKKIKVISKMHPLPSNVYTLKSNSPIKVSVGDIIELYGDGFYKRLIITEPRDNCKGCPLLYHTSNTYCGCSVLRHTKNYGSVGLCHKINKRKRLNTYIGFEDIDKVMEAL